MMSLDNKGFFKAKYGTEYRTGKLSILVLLRLLGSVRVADPDPRFFLEAGSGSALERKARSGSALKSKFKSFGGSK
jgi:hypothetical protein